MALKQPNRIAAIAKANPNGSPNRAFIDGLYLALRGTPATDKEFAIHRKESNKDAANLILGAKDSPFSPSSTNYVGAPASKNIPSTLPPEEDLASKINKEVNAKTPGFEKEAYWNYLRDYGIEIPELSQKYGVPPDFNYGKSAYGLYETGVAGQRVMGAQTLTDQLNQLDIQRKDVLSQWEDLKKKIQNGELDASSDEAQALARNLEQQSLAVDQAKRGLSARGTYFGGLKTRQLALTAQPYEQQASDIKTQKERTFRDLALQKSSGQTAYDLAMQTYLGNKKGAFTTYGIEQGQGGQFSAGNEFGGGVWNPTTQRFENVQWGITPKQAKTKGLEFFGTSPYDILIEQQQKKMELEATGKGGMTEEIGGQREDLINRLSRGY